MFFLKNIFFITCLTVTLTVTLTIIQFPRCLCSFYWHHVQVALRETEQRSDMKLEVVARSHASFPEEIGIKIGNVTYRSVSQQSVAVRSSP
jgi:hypothetical protein